MAWLFEGRWTVYVLLVIGVAACAWLWWRAQERRYVFAMAGLTLLAGVYALLNVLVETDSEQIVRKLHAMAEAVKLKDSSRIFEHISQDFHYSHLNKEGFRARGDWFMRQEQITEVEVWDVKSPRFFAADQPPPKLPLTSQEQEQVRGRRLAQVAFSAKPKGTLGGDVHFGVVATFILDPDGEWRLLTFELFNPVRNEPIYPSI
jgi:hypothetical protein